MPRPLHGRLLRDPDPPSTNSRQRQKCPLVNVRAGRSGENWINNPLTDYAVLISQAFHDLALREGDLRVMHRGIMSEENKLYRCSL